MSDTTPFDQVPRLPGVDAPELGTPSAAWATPTPGPPSSTG